MWYIESCSHKNQLYRTKCPWMTRRYPQPVHFLKMSFNWNDYILEIRTWRAKLADGSHIPRVEIQIYFVLFFRHHASALPFGNVMHIMTNHVEVVNILDERKRIIYVILLCGFSVCHMCPIVRIIVMNCTQAIQYCLWPIITHSTYMYRESLPSSLCMIIITS